MDIKYEVSFELTNSEIVDILATAFEGGIGYWACLDNTTDAWKKAREQVRARTNDYVIEDVMLQVWENGDAIELEDKEEEKTYSLTKEKFINGCALFEKHRGGLKKSIEDGGFDAIEADCLIQYALFGEVIYG